DPELPVLAERNGLRIHEVAGDWTDGADTGVDIAQTAAADLRGIGRLVRSLALGNGALSLGRPPGPASGPEAPEPSPLGRPPGPAELASFARIGLLSTVAWLLLWLALRPALGAFAANALALIICSAPNIRRQLAAHLRRARAVPPPRPDRGRAGVVGCQPRGDPLPPGRRP